MREEDLYDDYYGYTPLDDWASAVRYFGSLAAKPEHHDVKPLFDLVKQISTSCLSASVHPTTLDETLYMSTKPLGSDIDTQPRLSIAMSTQGMMTIHIFTAGETQGRSMSCSRAEAFPVLDKLLNRLEATGI
jgi:hypothetical protein